MVFSGVFETAGNVGILIVFMPKIPLNMLIYHALTFFIVGSAIRKDM
jgi:hypothetical protein